MQYNLLRRVCSLRFAATRIFWLEVQTGVAHQGWQADAVIACAADKVGKHNNENISPSAFFRAYIDRAQLKMSCFAHAKTALNVRKVFVTIMNRLSINTFGSQVANQHIAPVRPRRTFQGLLINGKTQSAFFTFNLQP